LKDHDKHPLYLFTLPTALKRGHMTLQHDLENRTAIEKAAASLTPNLH
jgi:hypothetical protein